MPLGIVTKVASKWPSRHVRVVRVLGWRHSAGGAISTVLCT